MHQRLSQTAWPAGEPGSSQPDLTEWEADCEKETASQERLGAAGKFKAAALVGKCKLAAAAACQPPAAAAKAGLKSVLMLMIIEIARVV